MKISILIFATCLFTVLYSCSSSDGQSTKPNASFENTRWVLRSLKGVKVTTPEGGKEAFITFKSAENKFNGNAGCNNMFGTFTKVSNTLKIGPVARTEMYCEGRMDTEDNFIKALESNVRYKIKGDRLYLIDSTNKVTANFEAVYTN